jgi:hypothetical protein
MRSQVAQRLSELREELEKGQHMLNELDARREELTHSMLRISGAMQVLEELLASEGNLPSGVSATEGSIRRVG